MREALTGFVQEIRRAGLPVSVAESMDALRAAGVVSAGRETLREALAAALVKDEADRETFDEVFERWFAAGGEAARRRKRAPTAGAGEGAGRRSLSPEPASGAGGRAPRPEEPSRSLPKAVPAKPLEEPRAERRRGTKPGPAVERRRRRRALLRKPFRDMDPLDAEGLPALAEELARRFRGHLRRRWRAGRRGRLDFRRTIRSSVARGGVPVDPSFRRRRPRRPDLVAFCDVSGSVRHASELFAAVLGPCHDFFRRVRIFAFVDMPVEASLESGRLIPHERLDFHAFSDFGRAFLALEELRVPVGRDTILVVLGDARNNRRPPRPDALARLRAPARALWWLNPESRDLWGTGDSAIGAYAPLCDQLLECPTPAALVGALARLTRGA